MTFTIPTPPPKDSLDNLFKSIREFEPSKVYVLLIKEAEETDVLASIWTDEMSPQEINYRLDQVKQQLLTME